MCRQFPAVAVAAATVGVAADVVAGVVAGFVVAPPSWTVLLDNEEPWAQRLVKTFSLCFGSLCQRYVLFVAVRQPLQPDAALPQCWFLATVDYSGHPS